MFNRIAAAAIITSCLSALPVYAADDAARAANATASNSAAASDEAAAPAPLQALPLIHYVAPKRPTLLPALYAGYAALQGYDLYSTTKALKNGAREANPFMQNVVANPAMFWTVKALTTVGPMMAAESMWKRNKIGAIVMMAASNGVMAAVAAHNASVLRRQER